MNYFINDFSLKATDGKMVTREKLSTQNFILFFYLKDNTTSCTLEALDFADLYDDFRALGYHVYGVSKDTIDVHEKYKQKYTLPFTLISDVDKFLLSEFDVIKDKKIVGKTNRSTVRSTFVFHEDLEFVKEFRGVSAVGHAQVVLDHIQGIVYK